MTSESRMIFHTRAAPRDPRYCLLSTASHTLAASVFRQRRVATAAGRACSKFAHTFGFILTAIMGATPAQRARVLARPCAASSSGSASPPRPPPCPGNRAGRGARHGEEAVHGAEQGRPPRVEREVVHVQPLREQRRRVALLLHADRTVAAPSPWRARPLCARRRAVTAPSPQPSPAPPLVLEGKATASLLPRPHTQRRRELCCLLQRQTRPRCPVWHTCP